MASLNLSINGPSIKSSYQGVVNSTLAKSDSPTYAQWALFTVQAPLLNAFQDGGAKESILKVETKGEGELADLVEDFSEGRIQFAFVKVKDPNTALPKNVLIAWCGGGVPERTKGYFTSHSAAVSKVLHGYHVQITARSDGDLDPVAIIQKVSDASGAKYTAGGSAPMPAPAAPPVARKPVFTPTTSSAGSSFNPLVAARNRKNDNVDADGWGTDAPPVTRTQLEKVEPAYKPTKVNLADLTKNQEPSRVSESSKQDNTRTDVVRGAYQPVGKVDIAAIRAAAKNQADLRPTPVKGSYEPVGKVDIAAIRAKAQKPADAPAPAEDEAPRPSLAERTSAFNQPAQSERLTSLPKPKVAKKFGGASTFTGTKAPTPVGFGAPAVPAAAPVGAASRTFADEGGKTPAQLWAEKKARERGASGSGASLPPPASPIAAQKSGSEWKSGYAGKSWAPVPTAGYARGIPGQKTGDTVGSNEPEQPASPAGGITALKDRFKEAPPMGGGAPAIPRAATGASDSAPPPPLPESSRPSGGFALPGLPTRPAADNQEEQREEEEHRQEEEEQERDASPIRVAVPVPRAPQPELEPAQQLPERPIPVPRDLPQDNEMPEEQESHDMARGAATAVAEEVFGQDQVQESQAATTGGKRAVIEYDYEKAEDNEIELKEGEYVTNIEMVDDDWWMGTNSKGETGLFPSNYVTLADDDEDDATAGHAAAPPPPPPAAEPEHAPQAAAGGGPTATALFDYEAAEDNELSFAEGDKITDLEFPDDDWWFGHFKGDSGLFPANYVQLDAQALG